MRRSSLLLAIALVISSLTGFLSLPAAQAADVAPPAPTISIAKPFKTQKFTLSGNIGTALERPVEVQRYFDKWQTDNEATSKTTTSADGDYSFTVSSASTKRYFRIRAPQFTDDKQVVHPEVISLVLTISTKTDSVKLVLTRNRSTGFGVGTLGAPTDDRLWALQVKSGSSWSQVGAKVAEADGQVTIPFPLGTKTYRLVGDAPYAGAKTITSGSQTASAGPKNLGPHVLFVNTDAGTLPAKENVDYTGDARFDNGDPLELETLAVRGHSSVKYPKKSFKLKFIDQQSVLGLPKGKTFALLPNYQDHSLVRTAVGIGAVASKLDGMGWTPHRAFTELFVNGKYRGSYELIETLKIQNKSKKNDARLEIDAEKGAIVEINPSDKGATPGYFTGSKSKLHFGMKDPDETTKEDDGSYDPEGVTPEKTKAMQAKVKAFEAALYGKDYQSNTKGWQKYMDINSAVDFYLEKEFIKDWDGDFQASTFFYDPNVFDANTKLKMGPIWDVDRSAGVKTSGPNYVKTPTGWWMNGDPGKVESRDWHTTHWFTRIAKDPDFQKALRARWNVKYKVFKAAGNSVDGAPSAVDAAVKELSTTAAANDRAMWQGSQPTGRYKPRASSYSGEISIVKKWYKDRYKWMDSKIGGQ